MRLAVQGRMRSTAAISTSMLHHVNAATATVVKIRTGEASLKSPGVSQRGRAARLARPAASPCLAGQAPGRRARARARPAADLLRGAPPSRDARRGADAHVRPGRAGPALAQRADPAGRPPGARRSAGALLLRTRRPRRLCLPDRAAAASAWTQARGTHLAVVREHFLSRFSEPELERAGGPVGAHRAVRQRRPTRRQDRARLDCANAPAPRSELAAPARSRRRRRRSARLCGLA